MDWIMYVVAPVFVVLGAGCILLVVLQLPGGWVLFGLALVVEYADRLYLPVDDRQTFGVWLLGSVAALLALGEVIELLMGAKFAAKGGASRRGMIGALIGGVIGAILLTPLIPIPVVGTLIGAIVGTFAGAVVGELSRPEPVAVGQTVRPAAAASVGRILGTVMKLVITIAVWIALSVAAFLP